MKIKRYLKQLLPVIPLILMVFLGACKRNDGFNAPVSTDKTKPGVVTNIKVKNLNGAAYITYNLPNSPNLLYVLAQYNINGKTVRQTKASYYSDTVLVDGFAKSQDYQVTLWSVSRANIQSDPVTVTVHRDKKTSGLYVSEPTRHYDTREWTITLSRRIESSRGNFLGVAAYPRTE